MSDTESPIFDAAQQGNVEVVRACLAAGADPLAGNAYNFTALHCAVTGSNSAPDEPILEIMRLLVDAGADLEAVGGGGRTPLFLAAEFARSVAPVQFLLDAGANPDVTDEYGNTIVGNAMEPDVQQLLSRVTGLPIPEPPPPEPKKRKLKAREWRDARARIDVVFETLSANGLVTLHDAGTTQEDGFLDCADEFRERGGLEGGLRGFCFYTRQDQNRAKRTGHLPLAFWGAPDGEQTATRQVGEQIVEAFHNAGFVIAWNGSPAARPTVSLVEA